MSDKGKNKNFTKNKVKKTVYKFIYYICIGQKVNKLL